MAMKKSLLGLAATTILLLGGPLVQADESRSYTEGAVVNVSYIKVKPGMFDAYMKYLASTYKQIMEEQKKAGLILDYHVYGATARTPADPDLILTISYKNMAALDGLEERVENVMRKFWASREAANKASVDRGAMREELGSDLIRELVLK
jgi:hypothetical protein